MTMQSEEQSELEHALDDTSRPMTPEEKAAYRARRARRAEKAAREAARQAATADEPFHDVWERGSELFRDKQWEELSKLGQRSLLRNRSLKRFLVIAGRGSLYHGAVARAVQILDAAAALFPDDKEIAFYRGVAYSRAKQPDAALAIFRRLMAEAWNPKRVRGETAPALAMKLRDEPENEALLEELLAEVREIVRTPGLTVSPDIALVLQRYGHGEEAIELLDKLISERPDHRRTLEAKTKVLIEQSRIAEAVELSHSIIARWPDNPIAQFNIRVLGSIGADASQRPASFAALSLNGGALQVRRLGDATGGADEGALALNGVDALDGLDADWLAINKTGRETARSLDQLRRAVRGLDGVGFVTLSKTTDLWRRDVVQDLFESGLCTDLGDLYGQLAPYRRFYGLTPSRAPADRGVAVIMSKHGSVKFGGGEHFIASMADHYASMGYQPLILGCRPELIGESGQVDGHDFIHIENSPAAMRALFLERDVSLVHSLSSIGYEAAQALRLTNIPFIYGIHFWSDALGGGLDKAYFDAEGAPIPRPEFSYIVARAQTVYTNSAFTQRVIEQAHGMRCPVIFSVPEEAAA